MADLESSAVTITRRWRGSGSSYDGAARMMFVQATLVLTGQGGSSNKIPKALFGMSEILGVVSAIADGGTVLAATPSYDGEYVLLDADLDGTAADVTDTIKVVLFGPEQL